jgi:hypothetical protein
MILLLVIKKPSTDYAQRWGGKNAIENCEDYIYKSHYKGHVLTELCGTAEHSLHTTNVSHSFFAFKLPSAYSCPNYLHYR